MMTRTIFWHSAAGDLKAEVNLPFLDTAFSASQGTFIVTLMNFFWHSADGGLKTEVSLPVLGAAFFALSPVFHSVIFRLTLCCIFGVGKRGL